MKVHLSAEELREIDRLESLESFVYDQDQEEYAQRWTYFEELIAE